MHCLIMTVRVNSLFSAKNVKKHFLKYMSTCKNIPAVEKDDSRALTLSAYEPSRFESETYSLWESKNYFKPSKSETDSFVVLLPPPNVTGTLHLGHALTCTIQDVILRWKRMKGESVLWIPGIDHAGIATQAAVERHIKQTLNLSRENFKKEEFVKEIWKWKNEKAEKIIEQLRAMGASLDWSKLIFTLDSSHSQLVTNSFIQLYKDGLIYRKASLVNWSCSLKSSISDIEVDHVRIYNRTEFNVPGYDKPVPFGYIYKFAYKICDEDSEIVISTTRPETILGDVAVAIHPYHPNASKLEGKYVWHPFRNEKIPIILDEFVDPQFGTGAVKITPSHSMIDFKIGVKHNLKFIDVINEEGCINKIGLVEKFHGLKRFDARGAIITELKNLKLFRGSESHTMEVPVCSRSGDIIEVISKEQWFLKCDSLAEKALNAVKNGELKLHPQGYEKVWKEWLKESSSKDWNLSRQLWWGHQIPMYECQYKGRTIWLPGLSLEKVKSEASKSFGVPEDNITINRDPDVLDTWFSSGLLALNGAINQERKLRISLMVTGHDILFFWIVRMVMLSMQLTGELPFKNVLLHGLICDAKGKKMSKSLGNVVHPDDVINGISKSDMENRLRNNLKQGQISNDNFTKALTSYKTKFPKGIPQCGADALRFTLCSSWTQSELINFDIDNCISNKNFCNKILQGINYFYKISNAYKEKRSEFDLEDIKNQKEKLNLFDKWILSKLASLAEVADNNLQSYRFNVVANEIRKYMITNFCNFYLTSTKPILQRASSPFQFRTTISVFFHCQETSLRLLSPFMPFVTEALYNALPLFNGFSKCESVTIAKYPDPTDWKEFKDNDLESRIEKVSELLSCLRKTKFWLNLKKELPNVYVKCQDEFHEILFGEYKYVFENMGGVKSLTSVENLDRKNVLQHKISENFTILVEHEMDKATLQELFGSTISKEEKLKKNFGKLCAADLTNMTPSQKLVHAKEIKNLSAELEKIEDFKLTIERCRS